MKLNNVLKSKFTDEEYLAHQRELHRERCRLQEQLAQVVGKVTAKAVYDYFREAEPCSD